MQCSHENIDNPSAESVIVILDMYRHLAADTFIFSGMKMLQCADINNCHLWSATAAHLNRDRQSSSWIPALHHHLVGKVTVSHDTVTTSCDILSHQVMDEEQKSAPVLQYIRSSSHAPPVCHALNLCSILFLEIVYKKNVSWDDLCHKLDVRRRQMIIEEERRTVLFCYTRYRIIWPCLVGKNPSAWPVCDVTFHVTVARHKHFSFHHYFLTESHLEL